jgi:hypothetical protein
MNDRYYVYILVDPRNNKPFYVGKGTDRRMYEHVAEVKRGSCTNVAKAAIINELLAVGLEPEYKIYDKNLTEKRAYIIEGALINANRKSLTNEAAGHKPKLDADPAQTPDSRSGFAAWSVSQRLKPKPKPDPEVIIDEIHEWLMQGIETRQTDYTPTDFSTPEPEQHNNSSTEFDPLAPTGFTAWSANLKKTLRDNRKFYKAKPKPKSLTSRRGLVKFDPRRSRTGFTAWSASHSAA